MLWWRWRGRRTSLVDAEDTLLWWAVTSLVCVLWICHWPGTGSITCGGLKLGLYHCLVVSTVCFAGGPHFSNPFSDFNIKVIFLFLRSYFFSSCILFRSGSSVVTSDSCSPVATTPWLSSHMHPKVAPQVDVLFKFYYSGNLYYLIKVSRPQNFPQKLIKDGHEGPNR